jgi:chromosome segregation protein
MYLSHIIIHGFKSFAKKTTVDVRERVTGVVGPNGSGKSNIAEAIRFVLGEQSMKSMRSKIGADVIFKGSEHLPPMSRASVTMMIDNRNKSALAKSQQEVSDSLAPYLVYDELTLARTIYADGTSDYTLNGAKVRLKDVQELLSFAGIGGSAHTIINQGEADRILLASPKDRKEALEDALGLRVYHMRLRESSLKLEKVKHHVKEVELLRNEIKPHLDHLNRQVKKIEQQEEERATLKKLLDVYLTKEEKEIHVLAERIQEQGTSSSLTTIVTSIEKELHLLKEKKHLPKEATEDMMKKAEEERLATERSSLLLRKEQSIKTLGRLEGERTYLEQELASSVEPTSRTIALSFLKETETKYTNALTTLSYALDIPDIERARSMEEELQMTTRNFFGTHTLHDAKKKEDIRARLEVLEGDVRSHTSILEDLEGQLQEVSRELSLLQEGEISRVSHAFEEEKKVMLLESKLRELRSVIALRLQEEATLQGRRDSFERLVQEGIVLVGRVVLEYAHGIPEEKYVALQREELLRLIERSKLRIEDASITNKEEVLREWRATKERDEYLTKELADIQETEEKLLRLIDELTTTLGERFVSGVEQVSAVFSTFFQEVFPGGKAKLVITKIVKVGDEGEELEEKGVELDVSLPNKRIKEIGMFSGGERALVSIALLFSMSAITPPPFMVLDETDAPLDESNARKYGAMLKRLAEHSKLLVITHNRETMNHCDMLYGVTLGVEGGSKLLSINFKEAERLAQ